MGHTEENVGAMYDLRLSTGEIELIRAALLIVPGGLEVVATLDVQQSERVNNFGAGQR